MNKTCNKCNKELPIEQFYISNSNADCLDHTCKNCRKLTNKERYLIKKDFREKLMQELIENN